MTDCPQSPWISVRERMPPEGKAVICYGRNMDSHWPGIAYAKWIPKQNEYVGGFWLDCLACSGLDINSENEVDYWLDIPLPPGLHD